MSSAHTVISSDGLTLAVRVSSPRGVLTTRIARLPDNPWTSADVDEAVRMCQRRLEESGAEPGQSSTTRRVKLGGRRYLCLHVMGGPPTWWYPRISLRDRSFMVGWLRRAVAVWVRTDAHS